MACFRLLGAWSAVALAAAFTIGCGSARPPLVPVAGVPTKAGAAIGADLRSTQLARPHGCMIAPDGRLVIADSDNDRIVAGWVD